MVSTAATSRLAKEGTQLAKIIITAKRDGTVEVSVDGAKGASCTDLSAPFENIFGEQLGERQLKPEFYAHGESAKIQAENRN